MNNDQLTRRSFLRSAGILSVASMTDKNFFIRGKSNKIGLQMYTMRNTINKGNAAVVIEKIAAIGYKELEIFGYDSTDKFWGYTPGGFKKILESNGMKAPAAHIALEGFIVKNDKDGLKRVCDAAATIGNKYVVLAWLDEQYRRTAADYMRVAVKLNEAAEIARKFNLQMAYHNHDFEFKALHNERTGYDILLENTDAKTVKMELDLYWCIKAGIDPVTLMKENPGRFALWHIKDMDGHTSGFTEVGRGVIDFRKIFAYAEIAGLKNYFIEQDEIAGDVWRSIRESYDNLSSIL